jgi:hypothetical protein
MWYEISLLVFGLGCLGVFVRLYHLGLKQEREERMNMMTAMKKKMVLALALILISTSGAWADEMIWAEGEFCVRALPFDDVIEVKLVLLNVRSDALASFDMSVHWHGESPPGNLVYVMDGGGHGILNREVDVRQADIVLQNKTVFFGDNRLCRLTTTFDESYTGAWWVDCGGKFPPSQGGTPYLTQGNLIKVVCADPVVAQLQQLDGSTVQFTIPWSGMLAGR